MNQITCSFSTIDSATTDLESRTITGLAVPYGTPGSPSGAFAGRPVAFRPGSLTRSLAERQSKIRLIVDHDRTRPVGKLISFDDSTSGLVTSWRITGTPAGDVVLTEALDEVRDGLSIGVDVLDYTETDGIIEIIEARFIECSLVVFPAYETARVDKVAATEESTTGRGTDPRTVRLLLNLRK